MKTDSLYLIDTINLTHNTGRFVIALSSRQTGKTYTINVEGINGAAPDVFVIAPQPVLDAKVVIISTACKMIQARSMPQALACLASTRLMLRKLCNPKLSFWTDS